MGCILSGVLWVPPVGRIHLSVYGQVYTPMLSPRDVQVDSYMNPSYMFMTIHLKYSKTEPFGQGTTLMVASTGNPLCPFTVMLAYLALR